MQKIHIFVSDNMLLLQSNGQEKSFLLKKQECMDRICKLGLLSVIVGVCILVVPIVHTIRTKQEK